MATATLKSHIKTVTLFNDFIYSEAPNMRHHLTQIFGQRLGDHFWHKLPDPRKAMQSDLHNALADAYFQAKGVQMVYKELGVTK